MFTRRIASWPVGVAVALLLASTASAQHYQPFIEPGYFDHDLQFFAPAADIDTYGDDPVLRYGWFGSYNRMYIGVSRPEYSESFDLMDLTWGNRWDLGYMVDDVDHDHGWLISYLHVGGPTAGEMIHQQRINRFNEDDEGYVPPDTGQGGGGGGGQQQQDVVEPVSDRNDMGPPNRERFYNVTDSLNWGNLNSLELNKIFRMDALHHGGTLEPFLGVRWLKFEDIYQDQEYMTYNGDDTPVVSPVFPPLPPTDLPTAYTDATIEDLITDHFLFQNQMITGQLGVRWARRISRWNLSTEFRAFAGQNFQHLSREFTVDRTYYDGPGQGSEVEAIVSSKQTQDWHATATVIGSDIRAIAGYEITRDIRLEAGLQFLGLFSGVGRGWNIMENSEDVTMVGTTFGIVVNK